MKRKEYLLTDDAVRDLGKLENYVLTYQDEVFVEHLEDEFCSKRRSSTPSTNLSHRCQRFTSTGQSTCTTSRSSTISTVSA